MECQPCVRLGNRFDPSLLLDPSYRSYKWFRMRISQDFTWIISYCKMRQNCCVWIKQIRDFFFELFDIVFGSVFTYHKNMEYLFEYIKSDSIVLVCDIFFFWNLLPLNKLTIISLYHLFRVSYLVLLLWVGSDVFKSAEDFFWDGWSDWQMSTFETGTIFISNESGLDWCTVWSGVRVWTLLDDGGFIFSECFQWTWSLTADTVGCVVSILEWLWVNNVVWTENFSSGFTAWGNVTGWSYGSSNSDESGESNSLKKIKI